MKMKMKMKKLLVLIISISLTASVISMPSTMNCYAGGTELPQDSYDVDYVDDPDMYPFYANLNTNQKRVYEILVREIGLGNKEISIGAGDRSGDITQYEIGPVLRAVYYEHPELFWYGSINEPQITFNDKLKGYEVEDNIVMITGVIVCFNEYADDLEASKANFNRIISEIMKPAEGMSDGEKVYYYHNLICGRVSYDYDGIEAGKIDSTVYGTLIKGKAVCQGYSRTLQYLLREEGIPTHIIVGYATGTISYDDGEAHAWLVSKIEGNYYNIDITWDDIHNEIQAENFYSYIGYNFFLINDGYLVDKLVNTDEGTVCYSIPFNWSHLRDKDFEFLPACTTETDMEDLVGITREEAFVNNFDRTDIDGVVGKEEDYVACDLLGAFKGTTGDVAFTVSGKGVISASGSKSEAGQRLADTATNYGISSQIDWSRYKYMVEASPMTFILVGYDLYDKVINYDRTDIIKNLLVPNIGFKTTILSIESTSYYEFQNACYVFTIMPDIIMGGTKQIDKKATVIDWAERQGTIEIEQGEELNLINKKIKIYYNDFSTPKTVDANSLTMSGFDSDKIGYQDVTLTYTADKNLLVNTVKLRVKVNEKKASYTLGDVNDDGQINSDDAIRVLMHTQFPEEPSYALNQKSDFNGDGQVNSDDAIRLLMHTQFPDDPSYFLVDS